MARLICGALSTVRRKYSAGYYLQQARQMAATHPARLVGQVLCTALSLGTVLLWVAGCHSLSNPWQGLPPPATLLSGAEPVWEHLAARRQALDSLKGLAHVALRAGIRNATLDEAVVVLQRFEAIRLEGIGPVGQPLFLLIADAHRLSLYTPQEGRLLTGAASAANLMRLFGIALTPTALQYILLGDVPLVTLPSAGAFAYQARDNLYLWQGQVPAQPQSYRIWFEPYDLHPVRLEMEDAAGQLVLQVWYEDFQRLQGFMMPYRITLVQPAVGRRVVWQYKEVQLNAGLTQALFRMRVPAGTARVAIEDLPAPEANTLPQIW